MKKYTETHSFKTSEVQKQTLIKMKSYNINTSKFIRDAISEKIKREYSDLVPKLRIKKEYCPFSNGGIELHLGEIYRHK